MPLFGRRTQDNVDYLASGDRARGGRLTGHMSEISDITPSTCGRGAVSGEEFFTGADCPLYVRAGAGRFVKNFSQTPVTLYVRAGGGRACPRARSERPAAAIGAATGRGRGILVGIVGIGRY